MIKKIIVSLIVIGLGIGMVAYQYRTDFLLYVVTNQDRPENGPTIDIDWETGPETAEIPASKRPPNIVFILADDLGINDISTFGGGVARGAVPTPSIDAIAHEGALFTQAYAGNANPVGTHCHTPDTKFALAESLDANAQVRRNPVRKTGCRRTGLAC